MIACEIKLAVCEGECGRRDERIASLEGDRGRRDERIASMERALSDAGIPFHVPESGSKPHKPLPGDGT